METKQLFSQSVIIDAEKIESLPRLIEVLYEQVNRLPLKDGTRREIVKIMICDILQNEPEILESYLRSIK